MQHNQKGLLFSLSALAAMNLSAQSRPNVVLIISDEHQVNALGCYGSPNRTKNASSPTPNIDQLAQQGILYSNAYTASPLSAPARASLMTGVYPYRHTAIHHLEDGKASGNARFPGILEEFTPIGQLYRQAGYTTAAIGKMHVHGELKGVNDLGFDKTDLRFYTTFSGSHYKDRANGDWDARYQEKGRYRDMKYNEIDPIRFAEIDPHLTIKGNNRNRHFVETILEKEEQSIDYLVTQESSKWLEQVVNQKKPFFLHLGYEKPHAPYSTFKKYMDLWNPQTMVLPDTWDSFKRVGRMPFLMNWMIQGNATKEDACRTMAAYYSCISELDDEVGKIITKCKDLGIYDNTIFVYTTDHGDHMFTHSMVEKHCMYEMAARIPLIISYPKFVPIGKRCDQPVSLIDILPTVLQLCNQPIPTFYQGISLLDTYNGKVSPDRPIFSEFYTGGDYMLYPKKMFRDKNSTLPMRMCRWRNFKYIYTHGIIEQLYDLANDPQEVNNLVLTAPLPNKATIEKLRLLTLSDWAIDTSPLFNTTVQRKGKELQFSFELPAETNQYILYRSSTDNPVTAIEVARSEKALLKDPKPLSSVAYYWITAQTQLSRSMPQGAILYKGVPVATQEYPLLFPASVKMEITPKTSRQDFCFKKQRIYE